MTDAATASLDLSGDPLRIHLLGIGGAGMRAIATLLQELGHTVSGSDAADSPFVERLRARGISVTVGHDPANIGDADAVGHSTAVPDDNPELAAARAAGLPTYRRWELTAALARCAPTVAVAGTHGKTTTSALLAVVLRSAGMNPSFLIGGDVASLGGGAAWTGGDWFVIEADESDGTFEKLSPAAGIVTNLEADHLEFHGGFDALVAAFDRFAAGVSGPLVCCADDEGAAGLASRFDAVTYGLAPDAAYRVSDLTSNREGCRWSLATPAGERLSLAVPVAGAHNALNATAAAALAIELGATTASVSDGLAAFDGVGRRFEQRGEAAGVTFVDDYAHLPTEVEAAIEAGNGGGWDRVVAIFQPHPLQPHPGLGPYVRPLVHRRGRRGGDGHLLERRGPSSRSHRRVGCRRRAVRRPGGRRALRGRSQRPGRAAGGVAGARRSVPDPGGRRPHQHPAPGHRRAGGGLMGVADTVAAAFGDAATVDADLAALTTYRVGGRASVLVELHQHDDIDRLASLVAGDTPLLVVGNGSNMLVADGGFDGVAVRLAGSFEAVDIDGSAADSTPSADADPDGVVVRVGGAAPLPAVARQTAAAGLGGFEWAVGVPGSVGGAVRMNAGGHGSDMSETLLRVRVGNLRTGHHETMEATALGLRYRHSDLGAEHVVEWAELALRRADSEESKVLVSEIVTWRRANQPGGSNAGSVFTNPVGDSAGRLIDTAGCKGLRIGTAEVSEKHANFFQADPGGAADDVVELMLEVQRRVLATHGVGLVAETRLVGFPPAVVDALTSGAPA